MDIILSSIAGLCAIAAVALAIVGWKLLIGKLDFEDFYD